MKEKRKKGRKEGRSMKADEERKIGGSMKEGEGKTEGR